MANVQDLPQDILIFLFIEILDGRSILQCKQVCVRWRDLINHLETSPTFWKNVMIRESGLDSALEMAGNVKINESRSTNGEENIWKKLYLKWHFTWTLPHHSPEITEVDHKNSDVTCVYVAENSNSLGNLMISGHTNGHCVMWNGVEKPKIVLKHIYSATHIDAVHFTDNNGVKHTHVIVASKKEIKAFCLNERDAYVDNIFSSEYNLVCVKVFGRFLMLLRVNSVINVLEMNLARTTKQCRLQINHRSFPLYGLNGIRIPGTRWATLWNDKVIFVGKDLVRTEYDVEADMWKILDLPHFLKTDCEMSDICVAPNVFLFRNGITVLVATNKYFMISVDGKRFKCFNTFKPLCGYVTIVQIFGGLLALGTNLGKLFLYTFNRDEDLLNIVIENPVFSCKISQREIISIDIKFGHRNELVLKAVASKDSKIVDMRWRRN